MRSSLVAVVALVSAFLGGTGALLLGKAAGWVDGDTVVRPALVEEVDAGSPARVEAAPTEATARPLPGNGFDPAAIYEARAGGVVTVISLFGTHEENGLGPTAQGSGFVVSRKGYILTNAHVVTTAGEGAPPEEVKPATSVFVEFDDGDRVEAEVVGYDLFDDVALLKVDREAHALRPVPLGDSSKVVVGEPVAAIGTPFGQENTLTVGVVGATGRSPSSLTSAYSLIDAIQTDAPINRGNSGGPLLDARGRVIGINAQIRSASGTAEGVGFAVPINSAVRSMEQLRDSGRVRYAWVGITTQTVTPGLARRFGFPGESGAAVQRVIADSPADEAGLRAGDDEKQFGELTICTGGDLIVAIGGRRVTTSEDVVRAVTERLPGDKVPFTILRESRRRVVDVVLGERAPTPVPDDDRPCG
ncbi:MAG: trypsin-like peptidase domain-containing protein [Actinomycetota bacterium]|nr:trypsin-like peptidase domain-containing protein [Actinomycetota bacterium]